MSAGSEACGEERGEIVALANGVAQIRVQAAAACGACASRGACAAGGAGGRLIELALAAPAAVGDTVTLSSPAGAPTLAALLGYLLPPLCLLAGAIAATLFADGDAAAVGGALLGFGAGLVLVRYFAGRPWARALTSVSCETAAAKSPDSFSGEPP